MLNLAVEWGWRRDNPAKGIQRYREEKRDRWLTDEELSRLVRVLEKHRLMIVPHQPKILPSHHIPMNSGLDDKAPSTCSDRP
jgi:hypothetical protein